MEKQFGINTQAYEVEIVGNVDAEAGTVTGLYVGVIIKGTSIEVTNLLNTCQREHAQAVLLEGAAEEVA